MNEFDKVIERRGTGSTKWSKYQDRDILPFWVADMDFQAPPFVQAALRDRVEHGIYGYSETPDELIHAALDWLAAEFDWAVPAAWLVWLPGVVTGLNLACRAIGAPGDAVLINIPVYYPFLSAPEQSGRSSIEVPLQLDGGRWTIDTDALAEAVGPRTRLF